MITMRWLKMMRTTNIVASFVVGVCAIITAPVARADDSVTYEVVSDRVKTLDVEYFDGTTRRLLRGVSLPWRTTTTMADPGDSAELRANWRRDWTARSEVWQPGEFVTVRIYIGGKLGCEHRLDVGKAACYGRLAPFGPGVISGASNDRIYGFGLDQRRVDDGSAHRPGAVAVQTLTAWHDADRWSGGPYE